MAFNYDKAQLAYKIIIQQDKVNEYKEGMSVLLNLLEHPEALVTDMSRLSDWENGEQVLEALSLDSVVTPDSYLWEVAREITNE